MFEVQTHAQTYTHTHTHMHTSSEIKIRFTDLHSIGDVENMKFKHESQPKVVVMI